jgi:hypothetical protein
VTLGTGELHRSTVPGRRSIQAVVISAEITSSSSTSWKSS